MKVTFWGTRGSIAVPGRDTALYGGNTTCLELAPDSGEIVIIDAGTGIRRLGQSLLDRNGHKNIHLLVTHVHWDHIIGFPFFAPVLPSGTELLIDGHPNCMTGLKHTFDTPMGGGFFPMKLDDLKARMTFLDTVGRNELKLGGITIDSIPLRHPQGSLGFRFREGDKTLVFITDNELPDKKAVDEYVRFCKNADVLIHDAQYTPEEIGTRRGWGHSDYEKALELASRAGVGKLILFHHDPGHSDVDVKATEVLCRDIADKRRWDIPVKAAREDDVLVI
jgi:phosphoribosyl 1,2-cyclic phosphodiesterase